MAITTLTMIPEIITVPANTDEHTINFDNVLKELSIATIPGTTSGHSNDYWRGTVILKHLSGTSIQVNVNGVAISSLSGALTSSNNSLLLPIEIGVPIRYKGSAGSETFLVTIYPEVIV